ncbi:MAG: prepilin-type N-terminal cleavage/methylation domain-containing protein [bacterium]
MSSGHFNQIIAGQVSQTSASQRQVSPRPALQDRQAGFSPQAGFSLIELTIVIVVIGVLATIAMQSMAPLVEDSRRTKTEREMEMLAEAIVGNASITTAGKRSDFGYVGDVGAFPTNLQALYQNPGSYATWDGPYVDPGISQDSTGFKTDEWGTLYQYSGGITITSTGSGLTIAKKIADATSDYLLNTLNGSIEDAAGNPPGVIYDDSIDILITIPDGSGNMTTKTYHPDSAGAFVLDSLPAGTHSLRVIFTPDADTLFRYVTILPRYRGSSICRFSTDYFAGGDDDCSGSGADTLRPTGAGTTTQLVTDGCTSNWECVDDITADGDNTYVKSSGVSYGTDTYQTDDPPDTSCTITSVTVYVGAKKDVKTSYAKAVLRTYGSLYEGLQEALGPAYADYSNQWTTNPTTGVAWTWTEIKDMEIGVSLYSTNSSYPSRCTQVWVVVEYSN